MFRPCFLRNYRAFASGAQYSKKNGEAEALGLTRSSGCPQRDIGGSRDNRESALGLLFGDRTGGMTLPRTTPKRVQIPASILITAALPTWSFPPLADDNAGGR
jgi:hypothetical protein